ncbi:unnamed protein product [Rotaria magnacalcarata]|uniref:Uncharacterized protein n=1 Tax=Rotaria magnacalcarata TaxID=392030 RepID=A0A8S2QMQ4_9BILA|nr:unnamed protein product [Rotaria magnacalcarata]CAF4109472.1 unnamed protein product [Rotaria magnacalcarata]CAF4205060.1 unnamed protein product [Rotaria magnacalcarata]
MNSWQHISIQNRSSIESEIEQISLVIDNDMETKLSVLVKICSYALIIFYWIDQHDERYSHSHVSMCLNTTSRIDDLSRWG